MSSRAFNGAYQGEQLARVAFPLGGIGAGMICFEGTGGLTSVSLRNRPDVYNEPVVFAAVHVRCGDGSSTGRVLEGPVPAWKLTLPGSANGGHGRAWGLPRCRDVSFVARFPFATASLADPALPITAEITAWSPFIPGNADDSSLPVAALEYTLINPTTDTLQVVFSYHARNFMTTAAPNDPKRPANRVRRAGDGFVLEQDASADDASLRGACAIGTDAPGVRINPSWFRGGWFDALTCVWKSIETGQTIDAEPNPADQPSAGGSLYVPLTLAPGARETVRIRLAWHVGESNVRTGKDSTAAPAPPDAHRPWYAGRFADVADVDAYWRGNYARLRGESAGFADCFQDTTLPPEVVEAAAANLAILKSPTVMRQADGRLWMWEGCHDGSGCCPGSCTHVWNYAQAIPHLFPLLERTLRDTEYGLNQDDRGHQNFRASLPLRQACNDFHAAADGQLGGVMKVYREWRATADDTWLRAVWPRVKKSLDYCISAWDPDEEGWLCEPHHNTYDIEFWGPDGMCTTFYAGALQAAVRIGDALGDPQPRYASLLAMARQRLEDDLFEHGRFVQRVRWTGLRAKDPVAAASVGINMNYSPEAIELLSREGPKYQYGSGVLSDGVLGEWMSRVCGIGGVVDQTKIKQHLLQVFEHNFKRDLSSHANPQRPTYAMGNEAGLLLCSWPDGGKPTLPFVYSDEVWTGIEYQVASHLMMVDEVDKALQIVRAVRSRYDGRLRNPFDEYECGHWYGRAQASYALLQGLTGQRYDAVTRTLHLAPKIRGDFRSFLATATGYGTIVMRSGEASVVVRSGKIAIDKIVIDT